MESIYGSTFFVVKQNHTNVARASFFVFLCFSFSFSVNSRMTHNKNGGVANFAGQCDSDTFKAAHDSTPVSSGQPGLVSLFRRYLNVQ
jgi:hypothetical protein